jgi:hypothetical protein
MLTNIFKLLFRVWWGAVKWTFILMFPLFTLAIPVMPIYDWLSPWDDAVSALAREGTGLRWMVGFERVDSSVENKPSQTRRSYVLLPGVFKDPSVYDFVRVADGGNATLKKQPNVAFDYLGLYAVLVLLNWFVSRPQILRLMRKASGSGAGPTAAPLAN